MTIEGHFLSILVKKNQVSQTHKHMNRNDELWRVMDTLEADGRHHISP